jgi:hypothetical protein
MKLHEREARIMRLWETKEEKGTPGHMIHADEL